MDDFVGRMSGPSSSAASLSWWAIGFWLWRPHLLLRCWFVGTWLHLSSFVGGDGGLYPDLFWIPFELKKLWVMAWEFGWDLEVFWWTLSKSKIQARKARIEDLYRDFRRRFRSPALFLGEKSGKLGWTRVSSLSEETTRVFFTPKPDACSRWLTMVRFKVVWASKPMYLFVCLCLSLLGFGSLVFICLLGLILWSGFF